MQWQCQHSGPSRDSTAMQILYHK